MNILKNGLLNTLKEMYECLNNLHTISNTHEAEILDIEANIVENVIDEFNTITES